MRNALARHAHISWLVAWFTLAITVGAALALVVDKSIFSQWLWLVVASLLVVVAIQKSVMWTITLVIVAGLLVGLWRGSTEQSSLTLYHLYFGKVVTLSGIVSDDASYGPHGDQRLVLKAITLDGRQPHGQVWMSNIGITNVKRSDNVTVKGRLSPGFGSLAGSMFRAQVLQVSHTSDSDFGLRLRDWFAGGIRLAIPEPQASLASGYLVGQHGALPADLDAQFKTAGLTHAVVASGYNLTILVSFARQIFLGASKYLATTSAAAMIAGFVMISGLSPSMSRAGLVASLSLAAWYYGRRIHPLVLLPFGAAITVLINPSYLWGDIGWYLSFASFAGVIVLAPLAQQYFWGGTKAGFIRQLLIDTMSAQVATLPIMIFAFGRYSPYALLANVLVLPLVPLTMLLTFVAGTAALIIPALAPLAGLPATIILKYMTFVVDKVANFPGAQGELTINILILVVSYAAVLLAALCIWRQTRFSFREQKMTNIE